jgi:HD superfamily phosphohydrolase YqeK
MVKDDLTLFKKWFSDYCKSFYSPDIEDQKNISLKEHHTARVCENIVEISRRLLLDGNKALLAEAVALFHDIGRFPQYAQYKTFRDSVSVNHGLLGAQTLLKERILHVLPENEQELIIEAVKFHNTFSIPQKAHTDSIFFIKLIRDADKLDIWRVFIEYYESPDKSTAPAITLGLPDIPEYSKDILSYLSQKRVVSLSQLKTVNDFKILQLSWLYDLNFTPSFQLFSERDYLSRMTAQLPKTEEIQEITRFLENFVNQRLQSC